MLDTTILREYDIRGIVGDTLKKEDVYGLGRAFGTVVRRAGGRSVAVGYDGRLSSPALEAALVDGLAATGVAVYRIGLGPTPMLYFAAHHLDADGGMMITGSHNPPEYNGIKMVKANRAFFGDDIQATRPDGPRRGLRGGQGHRRRSTGSPTPTWKGSPETCSRAKL